MRLSRRGLLVGGAVGGGLVVAWALWPRKYAPPLPAGPDETAFSAWLTIAREGVFSKIAQAFGYDDIDFESHEFSRKFCVRSKDKKFAYDVCNARMIEYLLANDDLNIEIEGMALAIGFGDTLAPERIEPNLQRLVQLRGLMPYYLFAAA